MNSKKINTYPYKVINKNDKVLINRLPFYWRLSSWSKPKITNVVDDFYPFVFDFDTHSGLLIQQRNVDILNALKCVYKLEYNIGYLQDDNKIAKPYGEDFITYLKSALAMNPQIKKVLEIGCGGCVILENLKRAGYDVLGIDSSPFASKEGKKKGVPVITDFFPSVKVLEKFDLIYHVDVLEHIDEYDKFLSQQCEQLNDGGIIVVNVPDATDSLELGDISMAMHQHMNYFTIKSLRTVLNNAGLEVISMKKAEYGGSLYAIGKKKHGLLVNKKQNNNSFTYENFSIRAENIIKLFYKYTENILSDNKRSLGFYVPLRALPYISKVGIYEGFRFFDDTSGWNKMVFDGVNIPIEDFEGLKQNPVTDLMIMSLTFGDVIQNKVSNYFGDKINIITLSDFINRSNQNEK